MPMAADTTNARRIADGDMTKSDPITTEMIYDARIPKRIPITPPVNVSIMDSAKNLRTWL